MQRRRSDELSPAGGFVPAPESSGRTPPGPADTQPEDGEPSPEPPAHAPVADEVRRVPLEREGQYTRFEELGRGGQSVVRRAIDEFVGREVALKELSSPPLADAAWRRFLREARLTAQ